MGLRRAPARRPARGNLAAAGPAVRPRRRELCPRLGMGRTPLGPESGCGDTRIRTAREHATGPESGALALAFVRAHVGGVDAGASEAISWRSIGAGAGVDADTAGGQLETTLE